MKNPGIWWDESWNPMTGCTPVSEACEHCYAERMAKRFWKPQCVSDGDCPHGHNEYNEPDCEKLCQPFTPTFHPDRLDIPLRWRKPRRIFVCSMSDLGHDAFTDDQRDAVFSTMEQCPQHVFMLLTKRPENVRRYILSRDSRRARGLGCWPIKNLRLGVTAENQRTADERIPILLDTPAAVRFVSCEPLLGAVGLRPWLAPAVPRPKTRRPKIDWVILGGENGPGARPMQPEWALDVYRQCKAAGVKFWWKGFGSKRMDRMAQLAVHRDEYAAMTTTRDLPEVSP